MPIYLAKINMVTNIKIHLLGKILSDYQHNNDIQDDNYTDTPKRNRDN